MFIRTAGERDLEAIKALLAETWHATYDAIYGQKPVNEITAEWHSMAALRTRLTHPHSEFLVADDGKAIAGMAFAASVDEGMVVWLRQLYVLPAQQRRGIGAMLLDEVSESFPEASLIRLEVEAENLNAIGFYRAQGFIVSDAAETTQDEVSVVVMEKALA